LARLTVAILITVLAVFSCHKPSDDAGVLSRSNQAQDKS
jgi:hypothetical protein